MRRIIRLSGGKGGGGQNYREASGPSQAPKQAEGSTELKAKLDGDVKK